MPVIALTQEMGSLAKDVAQQLAAELGLGTLRHEVAESVAQKMHVPKSLINRLREGQAGTLERLRADRASMAVFTAEEVLDTAARGNVVLRGWGATCLLHAVPHVVCVRITRPIKLRVAWLMTHLDTDDAEAAEAEIRRSDQAHASRMNEQFSVTWGDPLLYDMVLNTERLSVDSCVQQIKALALRPEFAETPASVARLQNLALAARVRSALRADESTRGVDITITADQGRLLLSGIVASAPEREASEAVAAGVPGVTGVENQLRTMAGSRLFAAASAQRRI
jgi:cytidylate kinase